MIIGMDKVLHIVGSSYIMLLIKAVGIKPVVPTLAIGAVIECLDYQGGSTKEECVKDFVADIVGVGLGLLIIKLLK